MELLLIIITQDAYIGQRFTKRSSYLCGIYDKTANTMKEPFQIQTFMMYGTHSASASRRATKWSYFGTVAAKRGRMNTNTAKAVKPSVLYMRRKRLWDLWLS